MSPAPSILLPLCLLAAPHLARAASGARLQEVPATEVPATSPWGADYFPDVELTTHEGKVVHFFEDLIRDKVVVINFLYTNCPDACPLETARLAEVQDILGTRVGRDVFFYSISIDPARDTVEALANYAERFQVGPGWLFLRGTEEDVLLLRRKLGVLGQDETALADHSLSVVIGNQATGRWMRRSPFENAYILADEIGSWLHNWKDAPGASGDYSEAPKLRSVSRGESLFRTRCSACHVVGLGDGVARVGPNLQGVTHWRERAWLERWITEPDRMLAEGDEIALSLYEAYRRVSMPNMRLNPLEVTALIAFLDEESARNLASPTQTAPERATPKACCLKSEHLVLSSDDGGSVPPAAQEAAQASAGTAQASRASRSLLAAWLFALGLLSVAFVTTGALLWLSRARRHEADPRSPGAGSRCAPSGS